MTFFALRISPSAAGRPCGTKAMGEEFEVSSVKLGKVAVGIPHHSSVLLFQPFSPRLPRQTNPISGRAKGGITTVGNKSYEEWDRQGASEKQSQFGTAADIPVLPYSIIRPFRPEAFAPNKPNRVRLRACGRVCGSRWPRRGARRRCRRWRRGRRWSGRPCRSCRGRGH